MNVLQTAQDAARELLSSDPELTALGHEKLRAQVDRLFEQNSGTLN
jgi:hypothetical protein